MRRRFTNASAIGEGATGRRPAVGAATISVLAALMVWVCLAGERTAVLAVGARPEGRRHRRQQQRAEHDVPRRLPHPVARRDEPVHGIEPTRRAGRDRHLGCPPAQHKRPVGGAREPRGARELRGRRLLPYAGTGGWTVLREQGGAAGQLRDGGRLLHPPQSGAWVERAGEPRVRRERRPEQRPGRDGPLLRGGGGHGAALLLERPRHLPQRAARRTAPSGRRRR